MKIYKVIIGTAKEVEAELNKYSKGFDLIICGVAITNELTTVIIELWERVSK